MLLAIQCWGGRVGGGGGGLRGLYVCGRVCVCVCGGCQSNSEGKQAFTGGAYLCQQIPYAAAAGKHKAAHVDAVKDQLEVFWVGRDRAAGHVSGAPGYIRRRREERQTTGQTGKKQHAFYVLARSVGVARVSYCKGVRRKRRKRKEGKR